MNSPAQASPSFDWTEFVRHKLETLRFGSVQITVHDGRVTEIETARRARHAIPAATTRGTSRPATSARRQEHHSAAR